MLKAAYYGPEKQLLVDGHREDYEKFRAAVHQALTSRSEITLPVHSTGDTPVSHFVVRVGSSPNRVCYDGGRVIFFVAPSLQQQFLSHIEFPADAELPPSSIRYHHHYDGLGDDGTYIAPDSLPVVFALEL